MTLTDTGQRRNTALGAGDAAADAAVRSVQAITFRDLIRPLEARRFFAEVHGKTAAFFAGESERFSRVFSWAELNRLLGMSSVWSECTMKIVLDGRELTAQEFCHQVRDRDAHSTMQPEPRRIAMFVRQGATLVLDVAERLSPGLSRMADTLSTVMGAPVSCNIYCSRAGHKGFPAHFDTMDVFALHIAGEKTWRLYDGNFDKPLEVDGYHYASLARQHHERAKGRLLKEVRMTPGDVLYLPRGQYHEALASNETSLHLSFGVTEAVGQDFLGILVKSLYEDSLFRASLPHFDDARAHEAHLRRLGDRLREVVGTREMSRQMRDYQRRRALRGFHPEFALPSRDEDARLYRLKIHGVSVSGDANSVTVSSVQGARTFAGKRVAGLRALLGRDFFSAAEWREAAGQAEIEPDQLLEALDDLGVVEPV